MKRGVDAAGSRSRAATGWPGGGCAGTRGESSSWSGEVGIALDLLLVGQHLERIGDHATSIAEAVDLMVTGERMRQAELEAAA